MNLRLLPVLLAVLAAPALFPAARAAEGEKPSATQSELASKTAKFAAVAKSAAEYRKAVPATDLAGVKKLVGKEATLRGTVAKVFAPKSGKLVILNFADDYKTAASAVVMKEEFGQFPDLKVLTGKEVLVSGKVTEFQDRPELKLTSPDQLKLVR